MAPFYQGTDRRYILPRRPVYSAIYRRYPSPLPAKLAYFNEKGDRKTEEQHSAKAHTGPKQRDKKANRHENYDITKKIYNKRMNITLEGDRSPGFSDHPKRYQIDHFIAIRRRDSRGGEDRLGGKSGQKSSKQKPASSWIQYKQDACASADLPKNTEKQQAGATRRTYRAACQRYI